MELHHADLQNFPIIGIASSRSIAVKSTACRSTSAPSAPIFGRQLTPADARELIESEIKAENIVNPANLEEKAISLIGRSLYEAFIKGYTAKQWQTDPRLLPASIITRLPVRLNFDGDYFNDKYQGLPRDGYAALVGKMLSNSKIGIALNTDFRDIANFFPRTN